jgi:UDP-N-acetylmuramate dehydrogenase
VADTIVEVTAFDRAAGSTVTLARDLCAFAYRTSRFKAEDAGRFVICDVTYALYQGPPTIAYPDVARYLESHAVVTPTLADVRRAVLAIRARKGMVIDAGDPDTRSVGSFFTNPIVTSQVHERVAGAAGSGAPPGFMLPDGHVKLPAAWLIERAGLPKGHGDGRAGLSSKHPLAIVNRGGASARDVIEVAVCVKRTVLERFGVSLRPEPLFLGFEGDPAVEFLQKG